jgi:hypothetical protein
MAAGTAGRLGAVREALLLEGAVRRAAGYDDGARPRMRSFVRAARERAFAADAALDDGPSASALSLYREAAVLFMAARVTVEGAEAPAEPLDDASVLAQFRALPERGGVGGRAALDELVAAPPIGATPAEASARAEAARETVRWLGTLVEPRGLPELRFDRAVRSGALGLAAVALLLWLGAGLFSRENIALHKPVTTSGVHPSATSPPSGLTDGVISGAGYGVHTALGDAPWVQVDLGAIQEIGEVKIYNRGDGYFEDCLPLTLQLSKDGVTFVDVATRTTTFSQRRPWVFKAHGSAARYVRVRSARGKYVALSELEVYGK